ncbi:adenosylcobinamide-phosphate synthase CbiB [Atrimonas thermophila]|uniref:adenosylcobinamide-phosphate synthase CbiB n=1 Tax=Atrimonas thermophila TaxID=3064161 RepID=UPI00399CA539
MFEVLALLRMVVGFVLDSFLGDPFGRWHPVVWVGKAIEKLERLLFPQHRSFRKEFILGFVVVFLLVGGTGLAYGFLGWFMRKNLPLVYWMVEIYLVFSLLAFRSLWLSGKKVFLALQKGNLEEARKNLRNLVGRDTEHLAEWEVVRACVESLAENFNDAVVAPLFYASLFGGLGILIYKVVNTLDSMLGYRDFRYFFFGFASARLDDLLNFIPARLSALFLGIAALLLGKSPKRALTTAFQYARFHPSPNAGWPEAAMAGALGVRLGGVNYYQGKREERPFLGEALRELVPERIEEALSLLWLGSWFALLVLALFAWRVGYPIFGI